MKGQLFLFMKGAIIMCLCAACLPIARPATDISPTIPNSPTPTRLRPTQTPNPTRTPSPTPNPLAQYEGECQFCFIDGSDPLEPVWDDAAQGFTYQETDPREMIVIDENYRVGAGENILIENKIILVQPKRRKNIDVYGTLTIRDSLMIWQQTEYQQTRLAVKRGGTLIIENSFSFWGNQYWVNWEFEDGATVYFDHFVGNPWTTIHGSVNYTAVNLSTVSLTLLDETHDTTVRVSDAHHVWFELFPAAGTHTVTFPEKRKWADWHISELWPNTTVDVENSYIFERDISLSNDTHVTIQDTPDGFSMGWAIYKNTPGYVTCELSNLGEPGNPDGVLYADMTWDLPCNNSSLTVKNSRLQRAWPVTWGYVHLKLSDSFLVDIRNYGGPATMEVYDSTIAIVAAYKGGVVYIENTPIKEAVEVKDSYSVIYGYGVSGGFEVLETDGGRYVEMDEPGPPWN